MKSNFPDSNNPSSEVARDDGGKNVQVIRAGTILPPRRSVADQGDANSPQGDREIGLRIESNVMRRVATDAEQRLDVKEINRNTIRLEDAVMVSAKAPRTVVFKERERHVRGEKHTQGESGNWGEYQKPSSRWMLYSGGMVGLLVVLSIAFLPMINAPVNLSRGKTEVSIKVAPEAVDHELESTNFMMTQADEAVGIFSSYLRATDVEGVIRLIREDDALRETVRKHWRPAEASKYWKPDRTSEWQVFTLEGVSYGRLVGILPDQSKFSAYFTQQGGRIVMDWKATVAFSTASFEKLEKGSGDTSEIRGNLSAANFYTSAWPESIYRSCRLVSPDARLSIWCYIRRGDAVEKSIYESFPGNLILTDSPTFGPVTVRLDVGPAGALPNQWQMAEILHTNWVTPNVKP
jgi:hypothetical protein